jgi:hypothetical protein
VLDAAAASLSAAPLAAAGLLGGARCGSGSVSVEASSALSDSPGVVAGAIEVLRRQGLK